MKKLFAFIKTKEENEKASDKKADLKEKNLQASATHEQGKKKPRDLFWDDYSDVGYC